ncbi:LysR substrate-binding domain-containing protein [Microbacterium halophytorum]|uniref:LysR substrate-binding domain-containing protein n=1 Tax=Microbacterium halophytorum TaxID=2067568 RepID=UPI001319E012|nr:LysR substrate-binding domain-containing protein [Microbacterium halophytorum]
MDVKKLEAFCKAVDLASISRAAVSLHLTQSALSQQLSSLEASMGTQLLARTLQGVTPTQAGLILYRHAQSIIRSVDEAIADVRSGGENVSGRVSIGLAPYSLAEALAVPLLEEVRHEHPNVAVHVRENFGGLLSEQLAAGQIDMGILYTPVPLRAVHVEPIYVDELQVVSHADRGLGDVVRFVQLTDIGLYVPTRQHAIRTAVDAGFGRHDTFPRIAGEIESMPTLIGVIERDLGIGIVPATCIPPIPSGSDLRVSRLDEDSVEVRLAFCTPAHAAQTPQAAAVERILRRLVARRLLGLSA